MKYAEQKDGVFSKNVNLSPNSDGAMSMPSAPIDAAAQKKIQETVIN